jgi:hypothetical protein
MKAKLALGAALVLGAACSFPTPSDGFRCEITADCEAGRVCDQGFCVVPGGVDAQPPPSTEPPGTDPLDCTSWTPAPRHFMPCDLPTPAGPLVLDSGSYTYDTTSGTLSGPSNVAIASKIIGGNRVISVERLSLGAGATLRVTGSQPLVVASWGAIDVSGTIDASSGTSPGAGANPADCGTHPAVAGTSGDAGGGGGGGGGFQGAGGRGGNGDGGAGGTGGGAAAAPQLQGGCPGARGGNGDQLNGGAGGAGGGAVQLTARQSITITVTGKVHAGGGGGGGATGSDGAGGGGGSGGMIGLESPSVAVRSGAVLAVNGGGGGQGSNAMPGGAGQPGAPSATPGAGGTGGDSAPGGEGSAGTTLGGNAGRNTGDVGGDGGGGAGGGAGYIAIKSASRQLDTGAVLSPPAISP